MLHSFKRIVNSYLRRETGPLVAGIEWHVGRSEQQQRQVPRSPGQAASAERSSRRGLKGPPGHGLVVPLPPGKLKILFYPNEPWYLPQAISQQRLQSGSIACFQS
jgi:hypothetical protein